MMTLQELFIINLKKFRKKRGISQMTLARLCDTSGNYIGEIEMGRRIPSFEKIEKIAQALQIASSELFMQAGGETNGEKELTAKDFLIEIPYNVKKEIADHLLSTIRRGIDESFNEGNY
jgi:transcriptional regulator with XRE-family HTH domain